VALLILCAQYIHPQTGERCHVTYGFLSDDASHSSVTMDFCLPSISTQICHKHFQYM
jgi:hypothetical protein